MADTPYASFDDLVSGELEDGAVDVTLPSGRLVRVRGLSRYELLLNGKGTEDTLEIEARNISTCMVQPKLTQAQAKAWQKRDTAGGDIKALSEYIRDLSALGEGAQKSELDSPRDN
jgi:hypothetical protein